VKASEQPHQQDWRGFLLPQDPSGRNSVPKGREPFGPVHNNATGARSRLVPPGVRSSESFLTVHTCAREVEPACSTVGSTWRTSTP
jgi:hypothetical protein